MIHQRVLIDEFYINYQIHCTSRNFTAACQCVMVKCFKRFQRLLKERCPGFGGPYLTLASSVYWDWSHPVAREDPWRQHLQAYSLRWGGGHVTYLKVARCPEALTSLYSWSDAPPVFTVITNLWHHVYSSDDLMMTSPSLLAGWLF